MLDASYYLPKTETVDEDGNTVLGVANDNVVEVPLTGSAEVVYLDLENELTEDPTDLCTLLENESAPVHIWLAIAAAYANKGQLNEAKEVIQKGSMVFQNEKSAPLLTFTAWLIIRQSKLAQSAEEQEQYLKIASDSVAQALHYEHSNPLIRLAHAEIAYQKKDYNQALDNYDRILKSNAKSESNVFALIGKAKVLFQKKQYNSSLKIFQQVLILNPIVKPDPRIGIGLNFWKLNDKPLAVKAWNRSLEIDPNNLIAKTLITLSKFDSSFNSINDDEFIKNYSSSLDSLNSLLKINKENPIGLLLLISYYYSKKNYDLVKSLATKVIDLSKNKQNLLSDANFWLGRVEYDLNNFSEAQKFFTESARLNPENLLSKFGVGQSQVQRNNIDDSILLFESIYKSNSKILEVNYILGILYSLNPKNHLKSISVLEKYIRRAKDLNEPIILNAYLTLSRLFENKDNTQSLNYLSKSIELLKEKGITNIPIEILNNLGVFHFIKGNPDSAKTFFQSAIESSDVSEEQKITLNYNIARSEEASNPEDAVLKYNEILEKVPGYIYSKIRLLYLEILKSADSAELINKMNELLDSNASNLEIRAFYSWFLRKSPKKSDDKGENLESKHNKETLTKYDSHDTYALISLGNLYIAMAKEIKPKSQSDVDKKNQSFVRGAQLFQKVLSIDPHNAFAAQGIAIIFYEIKQTNIALEIFRKVRDSIDDVSVYINLGHAFVDVGQYSKAIESYEIALTRYGDENKDCKYLTLVGRAWFARGVAEKSLESYLKSLEYSKKSLNVAMKLNLVKLINQLKFNVSFIQFNIAQFVCKLDFNKRTVEDIKEAISGLNESIETLNSLSNEKQPPYPAELLKQRASMASNTLINQLERSLKEQEEYSVKFEDKLREAQELRKLEKARAEAEELKRKQEEEAKEAKLKEEYLKLQEQAREWEKERESFIDDENEEKEKKSKKSKNAIVTDDELSDADDKIVVGKKSKKNGKAGKRKTDGENSGEAKKRKLAKTSKKYKSADIVEDSDEDDGGFDESKLGDEDEDSDVDQDEKMEDEPDALEQAEAKIESSEKAAAAGSSSEKEGDKEDDDIDDLF